MKDNRFGQSTVLSKIDYQKIRKHQSNLKHRLILDVAWFTGERWGCIVQLKVDDVFYSDGKVKEHITFKASTRKAAPNGERFTRQIPTHSSLKEILGSYCLKEISEWLFPGATPDKHICLRTCDYLLRKAIVNAGLGSKGISTHSTRRSLGTNLHRQGVGLKTIQKIYGHKDIRTTVRYIDVSEELIKEAMELI